MKFFRRLFRPSACCGLLCVLLAGCARIADPTPPRTLIPAATSDLTVRQRGDEIILTLTRPNRNSDDSTPAAIHALEVFRVTGEVPSPSGVTAGILAPPAPAATTPALPEAEFKQRARHIMSIPAERFPEYSTGDRLLLRDKLPDLSDGADGTATPAIRRYAALFVNRKQQAAGLGRQAAIQPFTPPPAPDGLTAQVTEKAICLRWNAPDAASGAAPAIGYNIYRAAAPEALTLSETPQGATDAASTAYCDADFQLAQTYYYAVSAVAARTPLAESALSIPLQVVARDIFPPAPPGDFTAVAESGKVTLFWTPSPAADLVGYRLFRKERDRRQPIGPQLITGISYRDDAIRAGQEYVYEIQALDSAGNASDVVTYAIQAAP